MKAALSKIRLPVELYSRDPIESPLHARLLLLEEGDERFLLVQLELTSLQMYVIDHLKAVLAEQMQMHPDQIWITVSHTFSAPHTRSLQATEKDSQVKRDNEAFCSMLYDQVLQAAGSLEENLQEVELTAHAESCRTNVNRDLWTSEGWWKGENPQEFSSPDLPVIVLKDSDQRPIGLIAAYDLQSSWMQNHHKEPVISADLFGQVMTALEQEYPHLTCLLLFGCGGDQMPDSRFASADEAVDELVQALQKALADAKQPAIEHPALASEVHALTVQTKTIAPTPQITPTTHIQWEPMGDEELLVHRVQIGPIELIGLAPELNSITGHQLRRLCGSKPVLAASMVNGCTKYLPDQTSYERITYEAQNSRYMPGTAEQVLAYLTKEQPNEGPAAGPNEIWKEVEQ